MRRNAMTSRIRVYIFLLIQIVLLSPNVAKATCMTSATLRPIKVDYLESEPIELMLTLTNRSSQAIQFSARYPSFEEFDAAGIEIAVKGTSPSQLQQTRRPREIGGRATVLTIGPSESWTVRVFLQDYVEALNPGRYDLSYSIAIPCLDKDFKPDGEIRGQGSFQILIGPASDRGLLSALDKYGVELDSSDYWTQITALEALSVTTSPLVIPHLKKAIDVGFSDRAVQALQKFRGDHKAEQALVGTVRDGRLAGVTGALRIFESWNYVLPENDFAYAMKRNGPEMKLAMLRYAGKVLQIAYRPVIAPYVTDPDPRVAQEADRVEKLLSRGGK